MWSKSVSAFFVFFSPLPAQDTLLCEHCGKNRVMITRYSEGYGTEVMSDCMFVFLYVLASCLLLTVVLTVFYLEVDQKLFIEFTENEPS